jgi:hypothetical protein
MLTAACIGRVAENLTRCVDVDRVRKSKASARGDQGIEVDQPLAVEMKGTCLPGLKGL